MSPAPPESGAATDDPVPYEEVAPGADTDADPHQGAEPLPVTHQPGGLHAALEAILMVTDAPVATERLASVLQVPTEHVRSALQELQQEYTEDSRPRGFELRHAGGGWRLYSAPAYAEAVEAFVLDGQTARLTQAALETLAVIAYRQPVSRGRIAAVRGVNVDSVVRTLLTRGLIEEAGQDEQGGAMLYRTSSYFLERMGLTSLEDLPPLAPYLPDLDTLEGMEGFEP